MPRNLIFAGILTLMAGLANLPAQEPAANPTPRVGYTDIDSLPKAPLPTSKPSEYPDIHSLPMAVPASTPSGYPDIEKLRKPGSSVALMPAQPSPTPPVPGTPTGGANRLNRLGTTQGGTRLGGGALGHKRNSGRQHDVLVDQADSDPLGIRVAYRRAKTIAMAQDPGMANLLEQAGAADTDVEKRAYLKEYYTRLYDGVERADATPEMKKHVDTLRLVSIARYDPKRREVGGDEDIVLGRGGGRRGGGRNR